MSPKKDIHKFIPPNPENPFRIPEGYFDDVQKRVMEQIRSEEQGQIRSEEQEQIRSEEQERIRSRRQIRSEEQEQLQQGSLDLTAREGIAGSKNGAQRSSAAPQKTASPRRKKIYLQPYLSLAAAITGVALVVYIVLQSVMGNRTGEPTYDIATLDRGGIIQDESMLADAYEEEGETAAYSQWDEEAIVYLASNEVDLLDLIDTN